MCMHVYLCVCSNFALGNRRFFFRGTPTIFAQQEFSSTFSRIVARLGRSQGEGGGGRERGEVKERGKKKKREGKETKEKG